MRSAATLDRRSFLGVAGAAAGAVSLVGPSLAQDASPGRRTAPGAAKNLIMLVVDGMSTGALSLSDMLRTRTIGARSRWLAWMNEPGTRTALVETTPANGPLTDSAAGASAWAIGRPVNNGSLSITPEGDAPEPIFLRAKRAGRRLGLVTTSYLTDATPAAMLCNTKSRSNRDEIAKQMVERGLDLGVGGGAEDFPPDLMRASGVRVARTWEDLRRAVTDTPGRRTLGLIAGDVLPFALDRENKEPSMRDLAALSLDALAGSSNGFCLLIENENVDEAGHANDAAALAHDMLEVEDALDLLIEFARGRDDTLLVVTTDHACGNPGFSSAGTRGDTQLGRLAAATRSFTWIGEHFRALPKPRQTAESLAGLMGQATGADLDETEVAFLRRTLARQRVIPYRGADTPTSVMGSILANHLGVAFTGRHHATDHVVATMMGPGAEALPATCRNTRLHHVMASALGVVAG